MKSAPRGRNVVGIVPLAGKPSTFDLPWPDYLSPLREGYLAVERAVQECALAGCDSIWVVCNYDVSPLVKKRIGDYVLSPRYFEEKDFVKRRDYHKKWIPIYYTAISPHDRDRRDSLGWSILHGALTAFQVSDKMSKWLRPTKYFASFAHGIYDPNVVSKNRGLIRGDESFYLSYASETVRDGRYLSFTFFPEDWVKFKRHIKSQCTGGSRLVPVEERWSSQHFTLDKIFDHDIIGIDNIVEIDKYYDLDSWDSLMQFYSSGLVIPRPSKEFMKPYTYERKQVEHEIR